MPDAGARPRRLAITSDDAIWYADFPRGYLGCLDPEHRAGQGVAIAGGPKSEPYGISAIKDVIWYSESGRRRTRSCALTPRRRVPDLVIPGGGNIVRNTDVTPDGNFVLCEQLVNAVSLVELK